jgi:hypothetical protein
MTILSFLAFTCAIALAAATVCKVGNSSSCVSQVVDASFACYTCDSGTHVEAGSCAQAESASSCTSRQKQCEEDGGVFTWCFGDSCNVCSPRFRPLPLESWANKSVAFVTAHPDDLEALAGATVAALTKQVSCSNCVKMIAVTSSREPPCTSSSSPTATRGAAQLSAAISHPIKLQLSGERKHLLLLPHLVSRPRMF